jgi:hypothetical protein
MRKIVIYLLLVTMAFAGAVVVGGGNKDANASMSCLLPMLATGGAYTWCAVTNGSSDNSTITFAVKGFEGGTTASLPPSVDITGSNAPYSGATILYNMRGRHVYKGVDSTGADVVTTNNLGALPSTGSGFYAATLTLKSETAANSTTVRTTNSAVNCFQLDPNGPKRPLLVNCVNN